MPRREIKNSSVLWIDIVSPKEEDMQYLAKTFGFHELDLEDCLSSIQRPKIDHYKDYLFLVTHLPRYFKGSKRLVTSEVDVFIGKNYLITIHNGTQKLLTELFEKCQNDKKFFKDFSSKGSGYLLYEIMTTLYSNCFKMIDKIYERIEALDDKIFSKNERPGDLIREFSSLRREIINFRRVIKPQREVLDQLEKAKTTFLSAGVDVYFDDIGDMVEKIWDLLENQKEIADSLISTYESIVSNQTNDIIKILTIFSVIVLPLTLLSGIYGMNIQTLPFAQEEFSFIFVGGLMISVVTLMLAFFYKKKWL